MKIHTQDFKNESVNMGRQIDSIITYENTILHDELYGVSVHYEGNILKSVMKQLDIESSVSIPIGTTVNYQFGLKVGSSYTYFDYGNYIVYSAEKIEDANTYKIICYDKMLYTMKEYQDLNISYPITIRNYINVICVKLGITFNDSNTQFANYDKEIQQELYLDADGNSLGYTYRDVLDELAEATASIICINSSDKLEIRYPTNTNETINEDFLKDINVTFGEKYGAINTIVLSRSAGADNIYYPETLPEDIKAIKISDNQIMNWNDRDTYLPDIYNKLNGLEYYINDFSSIGIMFLEIGDFYNISIGSTTYKCLLLNDEINVTQGIEEIIHTDMPEEAETDYTKADKTDRRINQTNLIVDKHNQEINAVIQTTETIVNESIPNLQAQIDGAIQFWNGSAIPTLNNYPANEWTTEAQRNNHRADIYTVIQDVQGELKQGKSYRFDKAGNTWQWIELTDNELSAVQALANSKAKVFYTTPTVPYNLGDLWLNNGKLYRCKNAKDNSGSYSASDWEEAVEYTDDTVALLAQSAANAAQSTADGAVTAINNIKDTTGQAEGKIIYINDSNDDTLISAKFNGETNQATRSGRNLYNYKDTTEVNPLITVDNEGWITATYDNSSGNSTVFLNYFTPNLNLSPATDYAIITEIKQSTGTGILQVVSNGQFENTANYYLNGVTAGSVKKDVIATKASGESISNGLRTYVRFGAGESGSVTFRLSVLADTTITTDNFQYEAYGVSPSPDYPSEIVNLQGKNYFNKELLKNASVYNVNLNNSYKGYKLQLKPNTKYVLKLYNNNWQPNSGWIYRAYDSDNTSIAILQNTTVTSNVTVLFTTNSQGYIYLSTLYGTDERLADWLNIVDIQIEEKEQTPYAPYNNLAIKVSNKNLFDKDGDFSYGLGNNSTSLNNSEQIVSTANFNNNRSKGQFFNVKPNTDYDLSGILVSATGTHSSANVVIQILNASNTVLNTFYIATSVIKPYNFSFQFNTGANTGIWISLSGRNSNSSATIQTIFDKIQLELGTSASGFVEHEHQIVYFPLAEGQKLYEGSYLADDGIHNAHKHIIAEAGLSAITIDDMKANGIFYSSVGGMLNNKTIIFSQELEEAADIEYELEEEEIIPYNTEQQEAWNSIKELMTYKNITHIYSDAYAEIEYVKDNGLDIYETKANAKNKYTETIKKIAELLIEEARIKTEVSETRESLGNYYTKAETNSNINSTKTELQTTIQQNKTSIEQTTAAIRAEVLALQEGMDNVYEKSVIDQTVNAITQEVAKKVNNTELGTKIVQNYESVQLAWNAISQFIQFINAQLQIKDNSEHLLMVLDKTGQHFYDSSGNEIGKIGIRTENNVNDIAFIINGLTGTNRMVWGLNYNNRFIPVFWYEGNNQQTGTEAGGLFYIEAPLVIQENFLYLGQDENGPFIQGSDLSRKATTIGNTDDLIVKDSAGNEILVLNSEYLALFEQLEMALNISGTYSFDFKGNSIINVDNMATTDSVDYLSGNAVGTPSLYVGLKNGAGHFTLWASSSDARLKKNIKDTDLRATEVIKKIQHKQFDWKANNEHVDIGYIAQQLEQVNKNLIHRTKIKDDYEYQVNDTQMLALCSKALQEVIEKQEEQQKQIEEMQKEIAKLKGNG